MWFEVIQQRERERWKLKMEAELQQQLKEAGKQLLHPPASDNELLHLLDQAEKLLSKVHSPKNSMRVALDPLRKALIHDDLSEHSDVDVKVAVASCISEITRITVPDAPYNDAKMRVAFELIVSSFEHLANQSSRSYNKRVSILKTFSQVRSFVIMLDIQCDDLIVKMFEHFLRSVRDFHLDSIYSSMEYIMVELLLESTKISVEMLKPLLASVKKLSEGVSPVARKLGEGVLLKSATNLNPYLMRALVSIGDTIDMYIQVVALVCERTNCTFKHNDENASGLQLGFGWWKDPRERGKLKMVSMDTETELERQLKEAGKQLSHPPTSINELLHVLEQVEKLLSKVDQSPTTSMLCALIPSMDALIHDDLSKHSDVDVKVAVAFCINEIIRITAPDLPYNDDQMRDAFRLIVSTFEHLADNSNRSYDKRVSILETASKVRSFVILLDLDCDELIVEMFEHFLRSIRDYHLESIYSSMENIMVLILEESEEISFEMLKPLLASVKKHNEGILPIARKLGEGVLLKSATSLKPYLMQALVSIGHTLDVYTQVVALVCEGT